MTVPTPAYAVRGPARELWIALAALLLLLAWDASGWDLAVAHWYGGAGGFPWRDQWWARDVLHDGGRRLSGLVLILFAASTTWPTRQRLRRAERLFWFAVTVACLVLVPALKRLSLTSCPWDLAPFGGHADYVPHWLLAQADGGPGHCFPSGHAVAAFAFFSLYFYWRQQRPALAGTALVAVAVLGVLFGWAQLVRGAHFPSHTMWSAWLCWMVCSAAAWAQASTRFVAARGDARSVERERHDGPVVDVS